MSVMFVKTGLVRLFLHREEDLLSRGGGGGGGVLPYLALKGICEQAHTSEHPGESARRLDVSLKNTRRLLEGILGGGVLPVLQILTLFQTKKCNFSLPFSDQTSKIHTRFHTWP